MAKTESSKIVPPPREPAGPKPELIGVVDIGANQIRLVVAEAHEGGRLNILERARLPVPLGRDTFAQGSISRVTMNAAVKVLSGYRKLLDAYGVTHVRAVATSSVREAGNADAFCDRVFMATGLELDVIRPAEEAQFITLAVRQVTQPAIRRGYWLVVEVGGGSTLMTVLYRGQIISSASSPLGAIRLMQTLDLSADDPVRVARILSSRISTAISAMLQTLPLGKVRNIVALGSDARFVTEHVGKLDERTGLLTSEKELFTRLVAECCGQTHDCLARRYKLPFAEAETLTPALLVYEAVFNATAARRFMVTNVSMRDGLLMDLAGWVRGDPEAEITAGVINAAAALAERYHVDVNHARHVADLSLKLYDELASLHGLGVRERLLLEVAALAHEVGGYVSGRAHHKHSHYLISNSEVFGLRAYEQEIIANVARYHRRALPRSTHLPYMAMRREHRVIVCKLAALLRVADALERGHTQQVGHLAVRREGDEIILQAAGVADLSLERMALKSKADLFANTFGLRIRIEVN